MKKFIAILFLFPFLSFCQKSFLKEFTFIADNDFLISFVNDHYYSSGLFFSYRYVTQKNPSRNLEKRIKHWSLSHKIYTPYKSIVVKKSQHDRPFAALLYASYGNLDVKKKSSVTNPMANRDDRICSSRKRNPRNYS